MSEVEKKSSKKMIVGIILVALIILGGIYACVAYYFTTTLFPKTRINGIDCSEMSVEQAELSIKKKVEDYSLDITFRDESTCQIKGTDIGYEYVPQGQVQKILEMQDSWQWIFYVFHIKEYNIEEAICFDKEMLLDQFYAIESISAKKEVEPRDAYVDFKDGVFVVIPENEGNKIKKNDLYNIIEDAVSHSLTSLDVSELPIYEEPQLREDANSLLKERDQLNIMAAISITYELPNGKRVLDGKEVRNWLKKDENDNYTITEDELKAAVAEYVSQLAQDANTVGMSRGFKSTNRGMIEVSGGNYGYKIDQKAEINQILEELAAHAVVTREPNYTSREVTEEASGLGSTYIEMDLSAQHLWYYIDGNLYVESDFVSGTYTVPGRRTPPGIFLLSYKQKNAVLRGAKKEDGTYEYESPVSYWMPFNRGIGMHDATWRGSFGGSIYKYSGSHGCINLPLEKAKTIFAKVDRETPIILYY